MRWPKVSTLGCEQTELSADDCHAIATMLEYRRKIQEALVWVGRGLELAGKGAGMPRNDLNKLKRKLLVKLGRAEDAISEAWDEFCRHPSRFTYDELLHLVPKTERKACHAKAMDHAAMEAEIGDLIDLYLETKETDRLVGRLRIASDAELEAQSHSHTERAAKKIARSHPDVAARVFRALGVRIVAAGKSKYYGAAMSYFAEAWSCYRKAGREADWHALVAEMRRNHRPKYGFMSEFEDLIERGIPADRPSFLDQARERWAMGGQPIRKGPLR